MSKSAFVFSLISCLVFCSRLGAQTTALTIGPDQLIVLNGNANAAALFDEAALFTNNKLPKQEPQYFFRASYNEIYLPQEILIPLDAIYALDSIWFFDGAGKDRVEILVGDPSKWQSAADLRTDRYNQWRSFPLRGAGEFILLRIYSSQAQVGEMRFFATKVGDIIVPPKPSHKVMHSPKNINQIFGINAFVDDPLDILAPVASSIREYHNWDWDEANSDINYKPGKGKAFAWSPSYVEGWDFDNYYRQAKEKGLSVFPCLQGTAFPYRGEDDFNSKPIYKQFKAHQPQAYRDIAEYVFQFAGRYGNTSVDASLLSLRPNQKPLSGLGLITGLEIWNEPDKWWKGRKGYFHPFEYGAFLSAAYDGHEGLMGPKVGLKNADSTLPMIMGGLAETNFDYLLALRYWSDYNRKGEFPSEVINFHHYSNNAGGQNGTSTAAISPERDGLKERLEEIVQFRNKNFPKQEVWLSEFGYDSNPKSTQGISAFGPFDAEALQAIWLVRSYLAIAASGLDRAHLYMLRDVNAENPNKYNSSGLRSEKWNKHAPKPSYNAIKSFLSLLGDYHFVRQIDQKKEEVFVYEFESNNHEKRIWAVWLGTESSKQFFKYPLDLPAKEVRIWTLDDSFQWLEKTQKLENNSLKMKISEKPIFIEW